MNPQPPQPPQRQLRLEASANLSAQYANTTIISHTLSEVIMDFIQIMPNDPRARIQSRVVMTPINAKLLMRALQDNLARFEERHGEIKLPPTPPSLADQLFGALKTTEEDAPDAST
jgi:hypothetical protein